MALCPTSLTVNELSSPLHKHWTLQLTLPQLLTALSSKHHKLIAYYSDLKNVIIPDITWLVSDFYKQLTRNTRICWMSTGKLCFDSFPLWCDNVKEEFLCCLLGLSVVVSSVQVLVSALLCFISSGCYQSLSIPHISLCLHDSRGAPPHLAFDDGYR